MVATQVEISPLLVLSKNRTVERESLTGLRDRVKRVGTESGFFGFRKRLTPQATTQIACIEKAITELGKSPTGSAQPTLASAISSLEREW